jgi:cytochrome c biogenesis protein CcdA
MKQVNAPRHREPPGPSGKPVDVRRTSLADNPWAMLVGLFLVTGALGIPLLWLGRAFSTPVKVLLSVLVTLYTAAILWLFWIVMVWCYHNISEVNFR